MKKVGEEVAGVVAAALVVGLILLVALPTGYVVKVLVQTGSRPLLVASLICALFAGLATLTQAPLLIWLAVLLGVGTLVLARVEQVRLGEAEPVGFTSLPFEGYYW